MNASPLLIGGIEEVLAPGLPIVGAGLLGNYDFSPTKQFCGSSVGSQHVVGALFGGEFPHYCQIMHGCALKDGIYHTVTKMAGAVIYEVDGRPVVQMIDDMYGSQDWQTQVPVRRVSIGINYGERYGDFKEQEYVNRLIAGVLPKGEGIVIFEPDLNELVSNALKHAFPGETKGLITIGLQPEGDQLVFTVSDNGTGIPEDMDFKNTQSLGMQLVVTLVEQLEGSIELKRDKGTEFRITFQASE